MPPPQWDVPSRLLLIKTPFLLVRFVFFCLQIYLNLTALVFAIWNVGASKAAGAHVDGASAFVIFNSIATSLCISSALMDVKISSFSTSMVGFEGIWTGVFTMLQIAASIFVTLTGPPEFCEARAPISVCSSITILVPVTWLAATLLLGYFIAISTLCIAHVRLHPALWFTSIYSVVWFDDDDEAHTRSAAPQLPPLETSGPTRLSVLTRRHSTTSLPRDVENHLLQPPGGLNVDKPLPSPTPSSNAWWGRLLPGQAGRDHPFGFRRAKGPELRWWSKEENDDRGAGGDVGDSDPPEYPGSRPQSAGDMRFQPYPSISLNEDEPIPVDNRSEWLRAGQVYGV
ncbi:hypothetical protein F5148DRAFT_489919 [Russula earlei]|uniref:Uncharacterized protein n=1 Tax=Russula earlei TaxID=71964 RepID=A0ACC0UH38_9AGAM|nr:hypothetical protein F5148DRAFT_489919 [Russula earlei]